MLPGEDLDNDFEEDELFGEENEDVNDSAKNDDESNDDDDSKTKTPPADDPAEDKKNQSDKDDSDSQDQYRPSDSDDDEDDNDDDEDDQIKGDTVPLKKYLKVKAKLKNKITSEGTSDLSKQTLEEFAEESGLKIDVVAKLRDLIVTQARSEATKVADDRVRPIVAEKMTRRNEELFEKDFAAKVSSKYPELESKKEAFKKIAFSRDFLHLKTLDDIRNEFFPNAKAVEKAVKKESPEAGSVGGNKETETIDFAKLHENPDLYKKVIADPKLRAKYYSWQESSSD